MRQFSNVVMATALLGGAGICHAGPCTSAIDRVEQQVHQAQAAAGKGSGAGLPTAPQSLGAQLHHQPTPQSVESAESKAAGMAAEAIARARRADAAGNADACAKALLDAKQLYGLE